jgi:type IV pilus assembly protein PilQ
MKKHLFLLMLLLLVYSARAQDSNRIKKLETTLNSLSEKIPGLTNKVDLTINTTKLSLFLKAIASSNDLNISVDPILTNINVSKNFLNVSVQDVLLILCKEHQLSIDFFGNILAIKKYNAPYIAKEIPVLYNSSKDLFTADFQNDSLVLAFRKITTVTGKNLVFSEEALRDRKISAFIKEVPFDAAIDKIALTNQLEVTKTKDNFYLFKASSEGVTRNPRRLNMSESYSFKITDTVHQLLEVSFIDAPIENIINDVAYGLKINLATKKELKNIGKATIKSDSISFNKLLNKLLEGTKHSYKLENGMYFFGKTKGVSVEKTEVIPLVNRSIELMMQPLQNSSGFSSNQSMNNSFSQDGNFNQNMSGRGNSITGNQRTQNTGYNRSIENRGNNYNNKNQNSNSEDLKSIFPEGVLDSLDIGTDLEQNSFIVKGNAQHIEKFKKFIKKIDKSVPLILIEVMIIEVNKSSSVSAGIDIGVGDAPVKSQGSIFQGTDLTIGAARINKIIGGLTIGSLNIGNVSPNFYAKIQALETNGNLKIRSTPKLSALNGHTASLSNGKRTYYTQTLVNTVGVENPQTQQYENFIPIDANLSIKIRPIVSGDGSITLSIDVQQSSFSNGERVGDGAPPDIDTRQFNSTLRIRDQDVVILGGLEVDSKSNSGSGVPFLAKIPLIKWLFSKRVRTAQKSKLSVLIKPSIIRAE